MIDEVVVKDCSICEEKGGAKTMDKRNLKMTANEVRKGIVTAVHSAGQDTRGDPFPRQMCLPIYILKR